MWFEAVEMWRGEGKKYLMSRARKGKQQRKKTSPFASLLGSEVGIQRLSERSSNTEALPKNSDREKKVRAEK
jgi:hypothetical protein